MGGGKNRKEREGKERDMGRREGYIMDWLWDMWRSLVFGVMGYEWNDIMIFYRGRFCCLE